MSEQVVPESSKARAELDQRGTFLDRMSPVEKLRVALAAVALVASVVIYGLNGSASTQTADDFGHNLLQLLLNICPEVALVSIVVITANTFLRGATEQDDMKELIRGETSGVKTGLDNLGQGLEETNKTIGNLVAAIEDAPPARVVTPEQIGKVMKRMRLKTSRYRYVGNSGRHFTSVTLPSLGDGNDQVSIECQVIDPREDAVCATYARARGREPGEVRIELCATVVLICLMARRYPKLQFKTIGLRKSVLGVRVDRADDALILTSEGKEDPALLVTGAASDSLRIQSEQIIETLMQSGEQLTARIERVPRTPNNAAIDANKVRDTLTVLQWGTIFDDSECKKIAAAIQGRGNPYDR